MAVTEELIENILLDAEGLADAPVGELHQLTNGKRLDRAEQHAAKDAIRIRMTRELGKNGISMVTGKGTCLSNHKIVIGVKPGSAGMVFNVVSVTFRLN